MPIATATLVQIIITTPTLTGTNANHAIIVTKSTKLLIQHTHLKTHFQILKIAITP